MNNCKNYFKTQMCLCTYTIGVSKNNLKNVKDTLLDKFFKRNFRN